MSALYQNRQVQKEHAMRFHIPDMSCGHCRGVIEKLLTDADPQAQLAFDNAARVLTLSSGLSADAVLKLLDDDGFPAQLQDA